MKKIESFKSWLKSVLYSGIAVSLYKSRELLEESLRDEYWVYLLLLVAVVILYKCIELLSDKLIAKSEFLRKMILGSDFIEGWWIDKITEDEETESVGILKISYLDGNYQITGDSCDLNGNRLGNFKTDTAVYYNNALRYAYTGMNKRQKDSTLDGYGEYHFSVSNKSHPVAFNGFIYDTRHKQIVQVDAASITTEELLKSIDTVSGRKFIIQKFLNDELLNYQHETHKSGKG